jgi:hypothetical protein
LTAFERRWAVDLLSAFAPEGGRGLSPLPGEVDYLAMFDRMSRGATRLAALGLRAALWIVAFAPLWQRGKLQTLSASSMQARAGVLATLLVHRNFIVRELTLLLKLCASMALFASQSVRARSAYDDVSDAPANKSGLRRKQGALVVLDNEAEHARKSA